MFAADEEILKRAAAILNTSTFGGIVRTTAEKYRAVSDRIHTVRATDPAGWRGLEGFARTPGYAAVCRAAWTRRTRVEVASAYLDLRDRRAPVGEALARLHHWVPEAERYCPASPRDCSRLCRAPRTSPRRSRRSKRGQIRLLPSGWMGLLWRAALDREFRHIDALAVCIATGCRPAEVCAGVAVRVVPEGVEVCIASAKVRDTEGIGQPWRRLVVGLDQGGPTTHLALLAATAPEGVAHVKARCSANALSMGITDLGKEFLATQRISAYDLRHQRCADARIAFDGDPEQLAAWLGHTSSTSAGHYGRLPRSSGVRGAMPLLAVAPRPVRLRQPRSAFETALHVAP